MEFANCINGIPRACEFGYIITDENFKIYERDSIIINPNIKRGTWDFYTVKNILKRPIKEYEKCPTFDFYYERIKKLIEKSDYVFGHSLELDLASLSGECKRYRLPQIIFNCYDNKLFFKEFNKLKDGPGVKTILDYFGIEVKGDLHDATNDACNTMIGLYTMLDKWGLTLEELIIKCPSSKIDSRKYDVYAAIKRLKEKRRKQEYAKRRKLLKEKKEKELEDINKSGD